MFLIHTKPYENESLASFIFRTAKENFIEASWILSLFAEKYNYKICEPSLNWLEDKSLLHISEILNINIKKAEQMTFQYLLKYLDLPLQNKIKCPWIMYHKTKFCPLCIKEQAYHCIAWSFTYSHICSKHNVFLIEKCIHCNRDITPKEIVIDQCKCNEGLSKLPTTNVEDLLLKEYQQTIHNTLVTNTNILINNWITDYSTFFKALEFLATWIPQISGYSKIPPIQNIHFSGEVIARTRLKKEKNNQQSFLLYTYAYNILRDWPNSYYNLIRTAENNPEINNFSIFTKTSLPKLSKTKLSPIFKEFINYISLYKFEIKEKDQLISLEEVPELIQHFNKDITNSKYFNPLYVSIKNVPLTFYKKEEIDNWCETYNDSITKEELRILWGTSAKVTYQILSNNLIPDIAHKKSGSMTSWIIPKISLEKFMQELRRKSVKTIEQKEIRTLNKTFEWIGYLNSHYLIQSMLEGNINYILNETNLGNTLISTESVYATLSISMLKNAEITGQLPIKNLTFLLGVKKSDIEHWIRTKRFGDSNSLDAVTFQNFQTFKQTYLTTFQLSYLTGLSVSQILKLNYVGKLSSVSGPKFNDGNRILFHIDILKTFQFQGYNS